MHADKFKKCPHKLVGNFLLDFRAALQMKGYINYFDIITHLFYLSPNIPHKNKKFSNFALRFNLFSMAEAFYQLIIENLCSLIQGEIGLIIGLDDEIDKLSSTLTTIQAVLADAEMKQPENRAIQNWLIKLNGLAHEVDDILDECATELSKLKHQKSRSVILKYLKKFLFRREIAKRIKEVTEKLDAVAAERQRFHLRENEMVVDMQIDCVPTRETGSVLNVSHQVYGREGDASTIVEILINHVRDTFLMRNLT